MATDNSELESFQDFLSRKQNGRSFTGLDEAVREFRSYQQELKKARNEVKGIDQAERGECQPLDIDEVVSEFPTRLNSQGITD